MAKLDVDWADLELAFRDATGTENYLDLLSGEVLSVVPGFSDEEESRDQIRKEPRRFLPAGDLALPVLGKVGLDNTAFKGALLAKRVKTGKPVSAAMTFPGGTHDTWLRYWMKAAGLSTVIVTQDKDLCQLVTERVLVVTPWRGVLVPQERP